MWRQPKLHQTLHDREATETGTVVHTAAKPQEVGGMSSYIVAQRSRPYCTIFVSVVSTSPYEIAMAPADLWTLRLGHGVSWKVSCLWSRAGGRGGRGKQMHTVLSKTRATRWNRSRV
jgi:hypothetical protein